VGVMVEVVVITSVESRHVTLAHVSPASHRREHDAPSLRYTFSSIHRGFFSTTLSFHLET
jgi:hypothetical protein